MPQVLNGQRQDSLRISLFRIIRVTVMLGLKILRPLSRLNVQAAVPSCSLAIRKMNTSATKIVATIGPASEQMPMLQHVVDAGLKIMRINFSHATYDEADLRVNNLRKVCRRTLPFLLCSSGSTYI